MHTINTELKNIIRLNSDKSILIQKLLLKEYLQNYALDFIYSSEVYSNLIFYGGTCLRKVYGLDRMSEDLDFESTNVINLELLGNDIVKYFNDKLKFNDVDYKVQIGENISRITLKFGILNDIGFSEFIDEKLHIKIEVNFVDGKFPVEITPINVSRFTMLVKHYDLSTLMAGKISACLSRNFLKGNTGVKIKGRDFYDLIWYMSKEIIPNTDRIKYFSNQYDSSNIFVALDEKIKDIKPSDLYTDLSAYFERENYIRDWCNNFHGLYSKYRSFYK